METKPTESRAGVASAAPCSPSWGDVTQLDGKPYYRFDYDSCDGREQWDHFCDTQDMLRGMGWELTESYVEHDCLTGFLIPHLEANA